MLTPLLALASLAAPAQVPEPIRIDSRIDEVTVYGASASIRRRATIPEGDGSYVVHGLPHGLDPDTLRVRCAGGEVVGVELRERFRSNVPDARVAELRERLRAMERDYQGLKDESSILSAMEDHVRRLLQLAEQAQLADVQASRVDSAAWDANFTYLREKLTSLRTESRELGWRIAEADLAMRDLRAELGRFEGAGGVQLRDAWVDVVGARGVAALEVEYVVADAGWEPLYDLRAARDLSDVELVYRAKVWQRSGEDWRDVALVLSTAEPQRGAQGPEPQPIWLGLYDPRGVVASRSRRGFYDDAAVAEAAPSEGVAERPRPFAEVSDEGISVRFRLDGRQTVESRDQPSRMLVGRERLAIRSEHYCVPALDTTVWLRGTARNTGRWVMLPGRAAVYFGADFIGHANLPAVQLGQELDLHLGPDPGLSVKRTKLVDTRETSGLFSSKDTLVESWRIELENHGAFSSRPDGAVDVIVHEVLPRAKDERIRVSIESARPALAQGERWKKEREERGILTWVVQVPRGATKLLELTTEIKFPEDYELVRQ